MRQLADIEQDMVLALAALPANFGRNAKQLRREIRSLCAEYVEAHDMCTRETLPPQAPEVSGE